MASIQNLQLSIVENDGAASALVTYRPVGSPDDIAQQRTYIETIELIGVDAAPEEDGSNELIAGARIVGLVRFPLATPSRTRHLALPAERLNEDKLPSGPLGHVAVDLLPDEIRARVTLGISAESNTVVLHLPVNQLSAPTPA